jgi:hypothetical protein
MNNATLREITIEHVKRIRALDDRAQRDIADSQNAFANSPDRENHAKYLQNIYLVEMEQYRSKYQAKSLALMIELRKREPDHVRLMDPDRLEILDHAYREAPIPIEIREVAIELDSMAQNLGPDSPR